MKRKYSYLAQYKIIVVNGYYEVRCNGKFACDTGIPCETYQKIKTEE